MSGCCENVRDLLLRISDQIPLLQDLAACQQALLLHWARSAASPQSPQCTLTCHTPFVSAQCSRRDAAVQTYGRELAGAYGWCIKFQETRRDADLQQAWDLYYHIFRRINKYLPTVHTLDLRNVSHILAHVRHLELAVPGTYSAGDPVVHITSFASKLTVRRRTPWLCPAPLRGQRHAADCATV